MKRQEQNTLWLSGLHGSFLTDIHILHFCPGGVDAGVITSSTSSACRHYTQPRQKLWKVQSKFRCQNSESGSVFLSKHLVWEQPRRRWRRWDLLHRWKTARKRSALAERAAFKDRAADHNSPPYKEQTNIHLLKSFHVSTVKTVSVRELRKLLTSTRIHSVGFKVFYL